jgi:hypothetical protein
MRKVLIVAALILQSSANGLKKIELTKLLKFRKAGLRTL